MRTPIIAGNWKMNMNPEQTAEFVKAVKNDLPETTKVEAVIAAPAVDLPALLENAKGSNLKVAAENCYFEDAGAFTGETSPKVLKEMGVDYVVIGHSERRDYFHETDEEINKKAHAIFRNGLLPIICCGESLETREANKAEEWVERQVTAALKDLSAAQVSSLVIAYEQSGQLELVKQLLQIKQKKFVALYVRRLQSFMMKQLQKKCVSNMVVLLNQQMLKS